VVEYDGPLVADLIFRVFRIAGPSAAARLELAGMAQQGRRAREPGRSRVRQRPRHLRFGVECSPLRRQRRSPARIVIRPDTLFPILIEPFLAPVFRDVLFQTGDVQAGLIEPRIGRLVRRDGGKDGVGCEASGASEAGAATPASAAAIALRRVSLLDGEAALDMAYLHVRG
jgi:hypothetical protein